MENKTIQLSVEKAVATLSLNRPEKLNAMNQALLIESTAALTELDEREDIKVLIVTGTGRAFCSGADLSDPVNASSVSQPGIGRREKLEPFVLFGRLIRAIDSFSKPTIAAVNGIAVGAGLALALACDIRLASEGAIFSSIFVKRGLVPDCGTTYTLPRLIGTAKALELMWTGDSVDASHAERLGLVNRVVPPKDLMKEANALATRLAESASLSIELTKKLVYEGLKTANLSGQLMKEDYAQYVCRQSEDYQEGRRSFLEKRPPRYKGG